MTEEDDHEQAPPTAPNARPLSWGDRIKVKYYQNDSCHSGIVPNHPSGDPAPPRADIAMTKQIVVVAGALGITLHDHIIVGRDGHESSLA